MKPMDYDKTVNCYKTALLDRAKLLSDNIFVAIDGVCEGLSYNDIKDIMDDWILERQTVLSEIANV